MNRAKFWSVLTCLFSFGIVVAMVMPGSYTYASCGLYPNMNYHYQSYVAQNSGMVMPLIAFAHAVLLLAVSLIQLFKRKKGFVLSWAVCVILLWWIAAATAGGLWERVWEFVPPVFAVCSMVTAFVAWRKSKSE